MKELYQDIMKLASDSTATTMDRLDGKRRLSDRLTKDKSCNNNDNNNNNNANKRMKHHQERQFGASQKANPITSSSSSDDNESDDNSSPFNLAKPVRRSTKPTNSCSRQLEKQPLDKSVNNKFESLNQFKKTLPDNQGEDSSSTSNCSCEQHEGNHEGDDREFQEKLDYDEDSITNSPIGSNSPINNGHNNNNTSLPVSSSEKLSSKTAIVSGKKLSSLNNDIVHKHETQQKQQTKPKSVTSSSGDLRLKSVININHGLTDKLDPLRDANQSSSSKSYHSMLKYLFKDACFFQMKSINHENIKISKSIGIWSTPIPNEIRLNQAFKEHRNVILIYSVQQSGGFQGFARMVSESEPAKRALPWILPERLSSKALRGVFDVQWICKKELPFHLAQDLFNPYNDNKPVKIARDGQQVESRTGKRLCKLFPEDDKDRLSEIVALMKHQTSQRKKYPNRYENDLHPYAYREGTDTWRRDTFPINNFIQHPQHQDQQLRRPDDLPNFNYRSFESHGPPSFHNDINNLSRQPPRQYHPHHYHHPMHNPAPYPLPINHYPSPQDVCPEKSTMMRHYSRDNC